MAWWQAGGDAVIPTAATLDINAVTGDVVRFSWSLTADGLEHEGRAEADYCDRPDRMCG